MRGVVLIVEDHPFVVAGLRSALTRAGFAHQNAAGTLAAARAALAAQARPDLALVDPTLPDGSGLDLLAELRTRHIPTIVLTGDATASTLERAMASGALGFVAKSSPPVELANAIDAV